MLLRHWIDQDPKHRTLLEAEADAHPVTLARWSAGISIPRPSAIERIHRITDGAVTAADHYAAAQARQARRASRSAGKDAA